MRKYLVNGGVFVVHHLETITQPREFINNMALTMQTLPSTLIYKDFYESYEPLFEHDLSNKIFKDEISLKEQVLCHESTDNIEKDDMQMLNEEGYNETDEFYLKKKRIKSINKKNQSKLIEISIALPTITNWWHTPVVCRWEPW